MEKFKRKVGGKAGDPKSRIPRSSLSLQALASFMPTAKMGSHQEDMEPLLNQPTLSSSFTRPDLRSDTMLASGENTGPPLVTNSTQASTPKEPDSTKGSSVSTSMWNFRNLKPKAGSPADVDEEDPRVVQAAMPQQYWVGRFMGLNDRMRNETHQEQLKMISELEEDMYPTLFHEGPEAVNSANEEFTRSKRVLIELDKFCRTKEAHESLRSFQEAYAKKQKDDRLLPVVIEGGFLKRAGNTLAQISPKTMSAIFARSTSGSKPKKSSLGAEITREDSVDEEDTLINWKYKKVVPPTEKFKSSPSRIPTPTFAQRGRSPSSQYSSPPHVAANTIVNDMNQLGFDEKNHSRGAGIGAPPSMAKPPSTTPYKPSRPSGMSRDHSIKNFSSSYQPRRPNTAEVGPSQGLSRSNTASNMGGGKTPRPSLPLERTVRAFDTKTSRNLPRTTSINNVSTAKTPENRRPIKTPSRNDTVRPLAVQGPNDVPTVPAIPKEHSSMSTSRTPSTKPPRVSSVVASRTPGSRQAPRTSNVSSSRTPSRQPSISNYTSSSRTPGSRQPRSSNVNSYGLRTTIKERAGSSNIPQNYGRTIHEEPGFADDGLSSNGSTLVNNEIFQSTSDPITNCEYSASRRDRLGDPCWDSKGFPFYFFEGERLYVKYRLREERDGPGFIATKNGSVVAMKVIVEQKHETWQRALTIGERKARLEQSLRERFTDEVVAKARAEAQAKAQAQSEDEARNGNGGNSFL